MTPFLAEIGQKLADRWAALVALPGLLYLTTAVTAAELRQGNALNYPDLSHRVAAWATSPELKSAGGAALTVAASLAAAVGAGLIAAAGGRLIETLWTMPGNRRPARWLASQRQNRSARLTDIANTSIDPTAVRHAIESADRICLVEPACPTWIGDRLRACSVRTAAAYGLDLAATWPRLWLIVDDTTRTELGTARDAFGAAARLTAWATLYLILGIWWWPAIPIALITGITGVGNGRSAAANLADLIEAAIDLHSPDLAKKLGEQPSSSVTPAVGARLTTRMRKSRWDPNSPLGQ